MANFSPETLQAARDAGYSDDQIYDHLSQTDPRFDTARQSGYKLDDVAAHFAAQSAPSLPTQVVQAGEVAPPEIQPSGYVGKGEFAPSAGAESAPLTSRETPQEQAAQQSPLANAASVATELASGIPQMVAGVAKAGYEGLKFAALPQERAPILEKAITEGLQQGRQIAQDVQSPLGTKESFRGLANVGMMAVPALQELLFAKPTGITAPPVQTQGRPTTAPTLTETLGFSEKQPEVVQAANDALTDLESKYAPPEPVPAAIEATTGVLGKQEPVSPTTASGTGEAARPDFITTPPRLGDNSTVSEGIQAIEKAIEPWRAHSDKTDALRTNLGYALQKYGNGPLEAGTIDKINNAISDLPRYMTGDVSGKPTHVSEAPVSTTGSGIQETGGVIKPGMYHGTREQIEGGLKPGIGKNQKRFLHEEGIWFAPHEGVDFETSTISEARRYSGDSGTIVKADLKLKNPYYGDVDDLASGKINTKWLKENGYDGFVDDKSGSGFVVVLDKSQIKEISRKQLAPSIPETPESPTTAPLSTETTVPEIQAANEPLAQLEQPTEPATPPVPAATEATTGVLGKQEPVSPTTASGTGEAQATYHRPTIPTSIKTNVGDLPITDPTDSVTDTLQGHTNTPAGARLEYLPIDDLTGSITRKPQVEKLTSEMSGEGGHISRLIVDSKNNVVEGQHRLEALRNLGATEVPVVKIFGAEDFIPDVGKVKQVIKDSGITHSDQVNQMMSHLGEALLDENGNVSELRNYDAPQGFEKPWNAAIEEIERQKPNAIQEQSAGSILQHPQESVGTAGSERVGVEPSVQGEETPQARQGTEAQPKEVTPEIPEGAKATVQARDVNGNTVELPNVDAKEYADKFTKERDSYKALIDCLGR